VTQLKECFDILKEDEWPITERDKIDHLLDEIQCQQLASAVSNISMNHNLCKTFELAANILTWEVHRVFPYANWKGKKNIAQVDATLAANGDKQDSRSVCSASQNDWGHGRANQGCGQGREARGERGQGSGCIVINVVDVMDATCNFTNQEWQRLATL